MSGEELALATASSLVLLSLVSSSAATAFAFARSRDAPSPSASIDEGGSATPAGAGKAPSPAASKGKTKGPASAPADQKALNALASGGNGKVKAGGDPPSSGGGDQKGVCRKAGGGGNVPGPSVAGPDPKLFDSKTGFYNSKAFAGGKFSPPPPSKSSDTCEYVRKIQKNKFDKAHWCVRNGQDGKKLQKVRIRPKRAGSYVSRITVYDGPTGHCLSGGVNAFGNVAALSSKFYGVNNWRAPMHGRCICVTPHGAAPEVSAGGLSAVQKSAIARVAGKTFKVRVADSCGECDDDHVDMFVGTPSRPQGDFVRAIGGNPAAYAVGTFQGEWHFNPCDRPCPLSR